MRMFLDVEDVDDFNSSLHTGHSPGNGFYIGGESNDISGYIRRDGILYTSCGRDGFFETESEAVIVLDKYLSSTRYKIIVFKENGKKIKENSNAYSKIQ